MFRVHPHIQTATTPGLPTQQPSTPWLEENRAKSSFNPTFGGLSTSKNHVSNHEREWIFTYLGGFYEEQLITDVLRRVKSGKEATVYCCVADPRTGTDLLAGKIYHERMFRSLKNDSLYREGRAQLDDEGNQVEGAASSGLWRRTPALGRKYVMAPGSTTSTECYSASMLRVLTCRSPSLRMRTPYLWSS